MLPSFHSYGYVIAILDSALVGMGWLRHWGQLGPNISENGLKAGDRKQSVKRSEKVKHLHAISPDKFPPSYLAQFHWLKFEPFGATAPSLPKYPMSLSLNTPQPTLIF